MENGWPEDDEYHYEINHVFEAEGPDLRTGENPASKEEHIEFFWSRPEEFEQYDLRPKIMHGLIANWMRGDTHTWQKSNFE